MQNKSYSESDPRYHVNNIKGMLNDIVTHTRDDVKKVQEPKAQALFETTAEVLQGLIKAYNDYENGTEPAWKR